MTISIIVADDHTVVRHGLRLVLEAEPDFHIVAETESGIETLQALDRLQPDILVLDLMLPGLNGIEVSRQAPRRSSRTAVVVLSMYANEGYVVETLAAGVAGYVLKQSPASELVTAIREAAAGGRYLSRALSQQLIGAYVELMKAEKLSDPLATLTTREREVCLLSIEGKSLAEIASQLFISARTVEMHRANFMRKLRVSNQAQLMRYALEHGMLPRADG